MGTLLNVNNLTDHVSRSRVTNRFPIKTAALYVIIWNSEKRAAAEEERNQDLKKRDFKFMRVKINLYASGIDNMLILS